MDNQINQQNYGNQIQQPIPNSTAVLVLGIVSIIGCFCYGVVGTICAIIAIILAGNGKKLYEQNMSAYTEASYKNLKAGKVCAIIGLVMSILTILITIGVIMIVGLEALKNPESIFGNKY